MKRFFGLQGTDRQHAEVAVCTAKAAVDAFVQARKAAKAGNTWRECHSAMNLYSDALKMADRALASYEAIEDPRTGGAAKVLMARHFDCMSTSKSKWTPPSARGKKAIQALNRVNLWALDAVDACMLRSESKARTEEL